MDRTFCDFFCRAFQGAAADRDYSPGYRWYPDGALGGVGNNGYSWSSSVSGTNGVNLDFNATWLNPSNANNRGHGFQVRCLQYLPHPVFT